jgi:flagellar basal body-associated protein FliL
MADKDAKPADGAAPDAAKKKPPVKIIAIVAALMVAEAVGVFAVVSATSKKPESAEAHGVEGHASDEDSEVELKLVDDKLQNMQTGKVWVWDISIYLKVKKKNEVFVTEQLKKREAEIKEEVARLFSKAQHAHLKEPGRETITRQLSALSSKIFGNDPEGAPRVERVLIPKCRGFPTE